MRTLPIVILLALFTTLPSFAQQAAHTINGSLKRTSTPPNRHDFTNYFSLSYTTNHFELKRYDAQRQLLCRSAYDGKDMSRWWKAISKSNAQDNAWIQSSAQELSKCREFFDFQDELIVFPLIWLEPVAFTNALPPTLQPVIKSGRFPFLTSEDGVIRKQTVDADARLSSVTFYRRPEAGQKEALTFETRFIFGGMLGNFVTSDRRHGIFLKTDYEVLIEGMSFDEVPKSTFTLEKFGPNTYVYDARVNRWFTWKPNQ